MKIKICICFFLAIAHCSFAQSWLWATNGHSEINGGAIWEDVASDNKGNAFISGWYLGDVAFGGDTLFKTINNNYATNPFISKFNSSGKFLWANSPKGKDSTEGATWGITTDKTGNVYLAGFFTDTINFGTYQLTSFQGQYENTFLTKYDPNGNVLWATSPTTFNSICFNQASSLCIDKSGNVYMSGVTGYSLKFGSFILPAAGTFLVKYDSNGNVLWAISSNDVAAAYGIATDNYGNLYMGGYFGDSLNFGSFSLYTSVNSCNSFLIKFDSAGNVIWARQSKIPSLFSAVQCYAITTDKSNNIYLTGTMIDTAVFNQDTLITPINGRAFIVKYDTGGNVISAWNDKQTNIAGFSKGNSIKTDANNNIFVSGGMESNVIFGKDTIYEPSGQQQPTYMVEFDSLGKVICSTTIATGFVPNMNGIAINPKNNTVFFGSFDSIPLPFGDSTVYDKGRYYPYIANWLPCGDSLTGIRQVKEVLGQVSVYPNPNTGTFTIALQNVTEPAQVGVYNVLGEQIFLSKLNFNNTQINVGGQPNGIYLYRVIKQTGELIGSGKILIQNK